MKSRIVVLLLAAGVLFSGLAIAQKPKSDDAEPLFFVKIAANVAGNVLHDNLNGYLGIYISEHNWNSGVNDGDLGPFLKPQAAKPGRSAACIFSSLKDAATCVYFDGKSPYGEASVKASGGGGLQKADIAAAYKPIAKEMLKKSDQEWQFNESAVNADDGTSLPAFGIAK